jgi:uncharacterized protein
MRRLIDLQYRFYDRMRHPASASVATVPLAARRDFGSLRGHGYCLLVTFRRDGRGVATPVSCGVGDDGNAYVRTETRVAKVRRVRNDPRVRLAPCSIRGKPLDAPVEGLARVLPDAEVPRADAALRAAYGPAQRVFEGIIDRLDVEMAYIEISPAGTEDT